MDNNEAEQALRNPVVGRKNYYGSGALWSAALSAILFTLFQTLLQWRYHPPRGPRASGAGPWSGPPHPPGRTSVRPSWYRCGPNGGLAKRPLGRGKVPA